MNVVSVASHGDDRCGEYKSEPAEYAFRTSKIMCVPRGSRVQKICLNFVFLQNVSYLYNFITKFGIFLKMHLFKYKCLVLVEFDSNCVLTVLTVYYMSIPVSLHTF